MKVIKKRRASQKYKKMKTHEKTRTSSEEIAQDGIIGTNDSKLEKTLNLQIIERSDSRE